jgi:hypothetical protein
MRLRWGEGRWRVREERKNLKSAIILCMELKKKKKLFP